MFTYALAADQSGDIWRASVLLLRVVKMRNGDSQAAKAMLAEYAEEARRRLKDVDSLDELEGVAKTFEYVPGIKKELDTKRCGLRRKGRAGKLP